MTIIPPFLKNSDSVGILSPAGYIRYHDLLPGLAWLKDSCEFDIIEGDALTAVNGQFAGSDDVRLADLQAMLDNPEIKAIFMARGGYGCSRIIDRIDWTTFRKHPKWLIGFSDITVLLSQIYQEGYASIHGPMIRHLMQEGGEKAVESLYQLLSGQAIEYTLPSHHYNQAGTAEGELLGGNLCLFTHLIGSASQPATRGKILFLEDVGEYYYNLDRMVIQMKRAGLFDQLAGLIIGQFSEMKDISSSDFGMTAWEIIHYHTKEFSYPKVFDFPVGHVPDNRALPVGVPAKLQVSPSQTSLWITFQPHHSLLQ